MNAQVAASLQRLISRYRQTLGSSSLDGPEEPLSPANMSTSQLDQLQRLSARLESRRLRVAVFGLVSRGKSAVINALMGEPVLDTGPLHGVTQWPRSVYWQPGVEDWQVELIDTPGLDEIDGQSRSDAAQAVAEQADLILFVVARDISPAERAVLAQLQASQKPLLLVCNKIDLYPEHSPEALRAELAETVAQQHLSVDDIVAVAAAPAPVQVRNEWSDGRITTDWETPAPQMDSLRQTLIAVLQQDSETLIALNVLRRARQVEAQLVERVKDLCQRQGEALIWRYARYKALAVAVNPIVLLDLLGGMLVDLVMIRALARLYGFPITSHRAKGLWRTMLRSSGVLLLSELGSVLLGAGKTTAALTSLMDSASGLTALMGAMAAQAAAAGYGTYVVGQAALSYLEQGSTWGPEGISTAMDQVLSHTQSSAVLNRLRRAVGAGLEETAEGSSR